mmetsp:Transcript_24825/g.80150  ORF Transcript_24825/g.80150 Transcript_24825/m.80150 type:complete len:286 (-) Transcript_24825:140-997(-)
MGAHSHHPSARRSRAARDTRATAGRGMCWSWVGGAGADSSTARAQARPTALAVATRPARKGLPPCSSARRVSSAAARSKLAPGRHATPPAPAALRPPRAPDGRRAPTLSLYPSSTRPHPPHPSLYSPPPRLHCPRDGRATPRCAVPAQPLHRHRAPCSRHRQPRVGRSARTAGSRVRPRASPVCGHAALPNGRDRGVHGGVGVLVAEAYGAPEAPATARACLLQRGRRARSPQDGGNAERPRRPRADPAAYRHGARLGRRSGGRWRPQAPRNHTQLDPGRGLLAE